MWDIWVVGYLSYLTMALWDRCLFGNIVSLGYVGSGGGGVVAVWPEQSFRGSPSLSLMPTFTLERDILYRIVAIFGT